MYHTKILTILVVEGMSYIIQTILVVGGMSCIIQTMLVVCHISYKQS